VCICHRHTAINRQNSWFSFISRPSLSLHSPIFLSFFDFITTLFFPSLLVCCCYCSGWTLLYTELLYHRLYTHTHIEPVHTCIKIWCIYMRIEREWVYIDAFISYIYFCLYFHFFFSYDIRRSSRLRRHDPTQWIHCTTFPTAHIDRKSSTSRRDWKEEKHERNYTTGFHPELPDRHSYTAYAHILDTETDIWLWWRDSHIVDQNKKKTTWLKDFLHNSNNNNNISSVLKLFIYLFFLENHTNKWLWIYKKTLFSMCEYTSLNL
jgi:hypothetical protein